MRDPVVVGTDGTAASRAAVRLAAREAVTRGCALSVVHAFTWPDPRPGAGGAGYAPARGAASRVVEEAVAFAQRSTPGVDARGQLRDGSPGRVLVALSRTAALLVIGGAGLDRLGTGALARDLVSRSWCPVALARGPRPPTGPVLAAVDGSPFARLGLRFAAAQARLHGCPLHVAHVVPDGVLGAAEAGAKLLDEMLAEVPELPVTRHRVLTGPAAATVVRASRHAGLVVLGPRGAGGARRLGSVAGEVLRRGGCPAVFAHSAASMRAVH
ncbi:universal stress protein [Actinoplanes sp. DH11]|uniref:universal stress protein n=1 Tax=Actinoplanes sp. DH11 TaxID=2857011 RepID=UPI001E29A5C7|nr:universal stress protein [Actinoplanes sp. DH11]